MTVIQFARPPYTKRAVPEEYDRGWIAIELGNIQRSILPATVKTVVAGAITPTAQDHFLIVNASAGPVTITLPIPGRVHGLVLTIKRIDNTLANAVTLIGTVDGVVNPTLATQYATMTLVADDANWWKV
ncbi:MAG TPA: hypothetical protein VJO33_02780 [Gemmatimonadaceae bacterium]|nr:hypothetical protein [Gemmatimonadaceae bacterium]